MQSDMGFLDYVSKTKGKSAQIPLTQLNLMPTESEVPESPISVKMPVVSQSIAPTAAPVDAFKPATINPMNLSPVAAPIAPQQSIMSVKGDITDSLPTAPTEPMQSRPTQSSVSEIDYIPPTQQTSPTQADKQFNRATPDPKSKVLALPPEWRQEDLDRAKALAAKYEITVPEMFAIIGRETGDTYSPSTTNEIKATGIIQFTPETSADMMMAIKQKKAVAQARQDAKVNKLSPEEEEKSVQLARKSNPLLWQLSPRDKERAKATAQQAVEKMTVAQQLDLKDMYLEQRTKGKKGFANIYSSIFRGNPDSGELKKGSKEYEGNKSLDANKDGVVTKEEWMDPVAKRERAIRDVTVTPAPGQPKALEMRYDPNYVGKTVTPADQDALYREAAAIAALADPLVPRQKINDVVKNVPLEVTYPGTPAQENLKTAAKGGSAGGLWWPKNSKYGEERIQITSSIPRPIQANVLAHEIGHSLGKNDVDAPGELQHFDGNLLVPGGRRTGVGAALKEGKRKLDADFAEKEKANLKALSPWAPDWLVDSIVSQSLPSSAVNTKTQRDTSGESPLDTQSWDYEQKSYPAPKQKKKKKKS